MDEPLRAQTPNEVPYYLMVTSCAGCGRGSLAPVEPPEPAGDALRQGPGPREAVVYARCRRCGRDHTFRFRWQHDVPAAADDPDGINPTDQPSRIIDLGQWVGLYCHFSDASSSAEPPGESRRLARRAALCLAEALKFHAGAELPPESAFSCEASAAAYRQNPANYARTRLRELQALLPAAAHRAHPDAGGADAHASHSWWRFWEK